LKELVGRGGEGEQICQADSIEKAGMGVDDADLAVGQDRCIVDEIGNGNTGPHGGTTFLP
jgi:hypothetical protein